MGIPPTGVVGPSTWAALDNEFNVPSEETILKLGSTGDSVIILQDMLKELGYYEGSVTGSFGIETEIAVKKFQADHGITPDGIVGPSTWKALYDSLSRTTIQATQQTQPTPTIRYGDSNEHVKRLQDILKSTLFYNGPVNSKFDISTLVSTKSFQNLNKLPANGIVGKPTWSALYSAIPPKLNCKVTS